MSTLQFSSQQSRISRDHGNAGTESSPLSNHAREMKNIHHRNILRYEATLTIHMHQVGLVFLAVIVTRSSAAFLQAKQGLSLGNQAVGWLVMGKSLKQQSTQSLLTN